MTTLVWLHTGASSKQACTILLTSIDSLVHDGLACRHAQNSVKDIIKW